MNRFPFSLRRLPAGTASAHMPQAAITDTLLAEPNLRALAIDILVDSVPLVHDGLAWLSLRADAATADALHKARLPALRTLVLTDIVPDEALLRTVAKAVARLGDDVAVELLCSAPTDEELLPTVDALDALKPIAKRIVALAVSGGHRRERLDLPWDQELPRLTRVEVAGGFTAATLQSRAFRRVEALFVARGIHGYDANAMIADLVASGITPRALALILDPLVTPLAEAVAVLAAAPHPRLEDLAVLGSPPVPWSGDVFEKLEGGVFPSLRRAWVPQMTVEPTRAGVLRGRVEIRTSALFGHFYRDADWAREIGGGPPGSTPALGDAGVAVEGSRGGPAPPDLGSYPRLSAIWRAGVDLEAGVAAALASKGPRKPKALEALDPFLEELGIAIDFKGFDKRALATREAEIAKWRSRIDAALAARDGADASVLFQLGGHAVRADGEIAYGDYPPKPVHAKRFLALFDGLGEPARGELAEVRGWCRYIATRQPKRRVGARYIDPSEYARRVLSAPFSERATPVAATPAPRSFETVTLDEMRRAALAVGIHGLLEGNEGALEGDARSGSIYYESGDTCSVRVAWCAEGVVAIAHDIYATDEVPPDEDVLDGAPDALRAAAAIGERIGGATAAIWLTDSARHRSPAARTAEPERGLDRLDAFVGPWPDDEDSGLALELARLAIRGGGDLPDHLDPAPGVLRRLEALGLRQRRAGRRRGR